MTRFAVVKVPVPVDWDPADQRGLGRALMLMGAHGGARRAQLEVLDVIEEADAPAPPDVVVIPPEPDDSVVVETLPTGTPVHVSLSKDTRLGARARRDPAHPAHPEHPQQGGPK